MKDFQKECEKQVKDIANYLNNLANDLASGNVDEEDGYQSLYDYFSDAYDIEYRIDSDDKYKSVKIIIAGDEPYICVDTSGAYVSIYWNSICVVAPISYTASDKIDDIFEEIYLATK